MAIEMNKELYEKLLYYCWSVYFERDEFFGYIREHDKYEEFLKDTEYHMGDCTKDSCPCLRCALHNIEIEAQRLYNHISDFIKDE